MKKGLIQIAKILFPLVLFGVIVFFMTKKIQESNRIKEFKNEEAAYSERTDQPPFIEFQKESR